MRPHFDGPDGEWCCRACRHLLPYNASNVAVFLARCHLSRAALSILRHSKGQVTIKACPTVNADGSMFTVKDSFMSP